MEEQETATKIADEKMEKSKEETTSNIKDKSPTTPSSSNSTWWGGWISQAKEKV